MTINSAKLIATFQADQSGANAFGGAYTPHIIASLAFTNGTGANQSDLLYAATRTVADGANDDVDLAGALSDAFGSTLTFVEITGLLIVNAPASGANTTDLTIGAASSPFVGFLGGTSPTIGPIKPGGFILLGAGDAAGLGTVTAGSADELRIANSAGAANTYKIAVLGRSA